MSNQVFATHDTECIPEIGGPLGPEFEGGSRCRVAECQNRGMERLPWCTSLELFGLAAERARDPSAPTPGVDRVADDRMSDVLQVHPDLVGATAVQIEPKQVGDGESSDHSRVRA